jgi:hypothetical protein
MRVVASSFIAAGTVAGTVAAVLAYQSGSSVANQRPASSVTRKPVPARVQFLPCERETRLVEGTCVRVVRRVRIHQLPAAVRPDTPAPVARPNRPSTSGPEDVPAAQLTSDDESDQVEAETVTEHEDDGAAEAGTEDHDD